MLRTILRRCFLVATALAIALPAAALERIQYTEDNREIRAICGTETAWEAKKRALGLESHGKNAAACPTEGVCDNPATRDATNTSAKTVRVIVHVINDGDGTPPNGVTQTTVNQAMAELNSDYAAHNISFNLVATRFHNDSKYYCLPNICGPQFGNRLAQLKSAYAETPSTALNIYVACMSTCGYILFGSGTFPWDPDALGTQGGIYMNSAAFGPGEKTLAHEMGHNLGLWHTHHGVNETSGCSDMCRENVHSSNDPNADLVGDFCKDTPATPTNYNCSNPSGTDCNGSSWGSTDFSNIMGYGPDNCVDHFTSEQGSRVHCWVSDAISSQLEQQCNDPAPNAPSGLLANANGATSIDLSWSDNANDEDGFNIERNGQVIASVGANVTNYSDGGLTCETNYSYAVNAYNCGGTSADATANGSTGTCPTATDVHVSAISMTTTTQGPWRRARATVTVVDGGGSPVANATVSGNFSGTTSGGVSGTTDGSGQVTLTSDKSRSSSYCWTYTMSNITGTGLNYDSGANVVSSGQVGNSCATAGPNVTVASLGVPHVLGVVPNPFVNATTINFALPTAAEVTLSIYSITGREIRTLISGSVSAGARSVVWDGRDDSGSDVAPGVYFYRLTGSGFNDVGRMAILR
ncbi:MAG: T9SS type A sorting domain-containing protein [Gemmatimonadetes bacterium]|nr:T9SS type A sorting domain-containing protein [Gemmatimonadota bacterium]